MYGIKANKNAACITKNTIGICKPINHMVSPKPASPVINLLQSIIYTSTRNEMKIGSFNNVKSYYK